MTRLVVASAVFGLWLGLGAAAVLLVAFDAHP